MIDPWKLLGSIEYPLSNQGPCFTVLEPRSQTQAHSQYILGLKSWFKTLEKQKTPYSDSGAVIHTETISSASL